MKLFPIYLGLCHVVFATEKKVPPQHPLQRLYRLVKFSDEIFEIHSGAFHSQKRMDKREKWMDMWSGKFKAVGERMEASYDRCGKYDSR